MGVIAACCFPLAPNWVKVWVFYLSAGLLMLILATLALRSAVALATWLASGRTVWLLPNLLSEARLGVYWLGRGRAASQLVTATPRLLPPL